MKNGVGAARKLSHRLQPRLEAPEVVEIGPLTVMGGKRSFARPEETTGAAPRTAVELNQSHETDEPP